MSFCFNINFINFMNLLLFNSNNNNNINYYSVLVNFFCCCDLNIENLFWNKKNLK